MADNIGLQLFKAQNHVTQMVKQCNVRF